MRKIEIGSMVELSTGDIIRVNKLNKLECETIYEGGNTSDFSDMIFVKRNIVRVLPPKREETITEIKKVEEVLTNVNVIEVKRLGEFYHGQTAIVSINSDETNELYLEYYKEEVYSYFQIKDRNDIFDLRHFSNDAIS